MTHNREQYRLFRTGAGSHSIAVVCAVILVISGWCSGEVAGAQKGAESQVIASVMRTLAAQPGDMDTGSKLLSELGLPIEVMPDSAVFSGLRAHVWREGSVDRIMLDGWGEVTIGGYSFHADRVLGWVHRYSMTLSDGQEVTISDIAVYFEELGAATQPSGMSTHGEELLMTARILGEVEIASDSFVPSQPMILQGFSKRGDARLVAWLKSHSHARIQTSSPIIDRPVVTRQQPILDVRFPEPIEDHVVTSDDAGKSQDRTQTESHDRSNTTSGDTPATLDNETDTQAIIEPEAVVIFRADELNYRFAEETDEGVATLRGNIVVQYSEMQQRLGSSTPRQLTLHADRAVIFTDPISYEDIEMQRIESDAVRGVYLEGNVSASDGEFTLRGPRMYYEFATNKAIVLDGVFHTYNVDARVPVYVRASEIRQLADNDWEAQQVRFSTSEFFVPAISLGASSVHFQRRNNEDAIIAGRLQGNAAKEYHHANAKNTTLRIGDTPVFWWPGYSGAIEDVPLRKLSIKANERNGFTVQSKWNLLGLLGQDRRDGTDISLLLDYYTKRGIAGGAEIDYQTSTARGGILGYLIDDDGKDKLSSGVIKEHDSDVRGLFSFWHQEHYSDDWLMILEANYISDVTFLDEFFEGRTEAARPWQTRLYLKQQRDNWALELFGNYDLNGFVPNEDTLQSRMSQVEKLPEIGYYRFADDWLGKRLSYSSEYRFSRMRFSFPHHTLDEIGQGSTAFGLPGSTDLGDALYASGLRETSVHRFFTRHEVSAPIKMGALNIVPFITGRFAAYDRSFDEFSARSETNWWYLGTGIRFHTELSRVSNTIDSRLFDLHRMRHIIEPSVTVWHGESDADGRDFPLYDVDVEGVTTGSSIRFGVRNTWQTQRGGEGRWRSVDWLRVDTDFVFTTSDVQGDHVLPRYFDYRPEYSRLGDHFFGDFAWLVSDSFSIAGQTVYDFNESAVSRGVIGYRISHSRDLFSYADLQYYDFSDDALLGTGLGYRLTPTYLVRGGLSYDLQRDEARSFSFLLTREIPQADIAFGATYNQIREEALFSVLLSPRGMGGRRYGGRINEPSTRR